jgi:hypothetical protein
MRLLPWLLALALILEPAAAATKRCERSQDVQGPCIVIKGTLKWWHNYPPLLRIESDDIVYGIWPPEHENAPELIRELRPYSTRGSFVLCPLNKVTNVPYDQRSIELYCLEKATISERQMKVGRKVIWAHLQRPLTAN